MAYTAANRLMYKASAKISTGYRYFAQMRCRNGMRNPHSPSRKNAIPINTTDVMTKVLEIIGVLLEGLVFVEIGEGQSERIDRNHRVRYFIFDDEHDVNDIL